MEINLKNNILDSSRLDWRSCSKWVRTISCIKLDSEEEANSRDARIMWILKKIRIISIGVGH